MFLLFLDFFYLLVSPPFNSFGSLSDFGLFVLVEVGELLGQLKIFTLQSLVGECEPVDDVSH